MNDSNKTYDVEALRYDAWFDSPHGKILFANELAALRLLWRKSFHPALEIGVGTGRFAQALFIEHGIDAAERAVALARLRGIDARVAPAESPPFAAATFSCVALITSLSFFSDPAAVLREAVRVLRPSGHVLIGEIPRDSIWGANCQRKKGARDPFFATMRPLSVEAILELIVAAGFKPAAFASTLIRSTPDSPQAEEPTLSRVDGAGFVGVLAKRA